MTGAGFGLKSVVLLLVAIALAGTGCGPGPKVEAANDIAPPTQTRAPERSATPTPTATPLPAARLGLDFGSVDLSVAPAAVSLWQEFLNIHGHDLIVDGSYGPNTSAATAAWQAEQGLDVTGQLDAATYATMNSDVLPQRFVAVQESTAPPTPTSQPTPTPAPTAIPTPTATSTPTPRPTATPRPVQQCHPSYDPCLTPGIGDYDCRGGSGNGPNYTGRVRVTGWDEFGLNRDNDGIGCE